MIRMSRWPRAMTCSAAARAPPDVVDLDRVVIGQRGRVDQNDRDPGPPDLLDLGMVVAQADGDHAVDDRPAHRPGQRAVQRRDEVERVAGLLGHRRDAFGERPEERVGEDDRQRLRRQHPDRQRLALRQHPRHRVRAVAQLIGHHADPVGRLRRQSIGAVERERDGRLGHAGLAGDVGDARSDRALFHGSPVWRHCADLLAGPPRPVRVVATPNEEVIGPPPTETKTGLANRFSGP